MRPKVTDRINYIAVRCRGKRVLHVGCADAPLTKTRLDAGTLLHAKIEEVAAIQYGIDTSVEGIRTLTERGYKNLFVLNAEDLATINPFGDIEFDVIVAGEVLEHLSNPGVFLDGMKKFFRSSSCSLILTVPNAYCAYRFVYTFLTGREGVNPDHLFYLSRSTLLRLLETHGYAVEDLSYYFPDQETGKQLRRGRGWFLWWTDRLAWRLRPVLADGLMVTCKIKSNPNTNRT